MLENIKDIILLAKRHFLIPVFMVVFFIGIVKDGFKFESIVCLLLGFLALLFVIFLRWHIKSVWLFLLIDFPIFLLLMQLWRATHIEALIYPVAAIGMPIGIVLFGCVLGLTSPQEIYDCMEDMEFRLW